MALCHGLISPQAMREGARRFRGVAHRMERIGELGTSVCYDSSIDTSPQRTEATLSVFPSPPVVIAGAVTIK